jgi:acetoin utilization deacetylase AcuC-like enzyme
MKVYYSDHYTVPLPEGHRFPMEKYRLLREKLLAEGILEPGELYEPELPAREVITLAHSGEYYDSFANGTIDPKIIRRIGLPGAGVLPLTGFCWRSSAARSAIECSIGGNLAGGTHHLPRLRRVLRIQ